MLAKQKLQQHGREWHRRGFWVTIALAPIAGFVGVFLGGVALGLGSALFHAPDVEPSMGSFLVFFLAASLLWIGWGVATLQTRKWSQRDLQLTGDPSASKIAIRAALARIGYQFAGEQVCWRTRWYRPV